MQSHIVWSRDSLGAVITPTQAADNGMESKISDAEYRAWYDRFLQISEHAASVSTLALKLANNDTNDAMDILELALEGLAGMMEMQDDTQH